MASKIIDSIVMDRKKKVLVTEDMEPYEYYQGLVIGPPDLSSLHLPEDVEIALNNELFARGLITQRDTIKGRQEIFAALQAAFAISVDKIMRCYTNG